MGFVVAREWATGVTIGHPRPCETFGTPEKELAGLLGPATANPVAAIREKAIVRRFLEVFMGFRVWFF